MKRINKFYKFTLVLIGIVMLAILFSCSSREGRDEKALTKEIDPELEKISSSLAWIDSTTSLNVNYYNNRDLINATLRDILLKKLASSDKSEDKQMYEYFLQQMEKETAQNKVISEVLKKAKIHTSKIVNSTLETKKVPSNCYIFSAFVEKNYTNSDDTVIESIPLLFETLKDCKIAEEILRNCYIGTIKCHQWQSGESSMSEEFVKKWIMLNK